MDIWVVQHIISAGGEGDGVYQNQIQTFKDALDTSILYILSINVRESSLGPMYIDR